MASRFTAAPYSTPKTVFPRTLGCMAGYDIGSAGSPNHRRKRLRAALPIASATLLSLPISAWQLPTTQVRKAKVSSARNGPKTFSDGTSQFTYPGYFVLYTGENLACDGTNIACVVFPENKYAGTTFAGAFFQEREIGEATTESECLTFEEFYVKGADPIKIINRVKFKHESGTAAAAGTSIDMDAYRAFHKGKCYELNLNVAMVNVANFDPGTIKEFTDENHVKEELIKILDSFRFLR
jgi:hypothetical protein